MARGRGKHGSRLGAESCVWTCTVYRVVGRITEEVCLFWDYEKRSSQLALRTTEVAGTAPPGELPNVIAHVHHGRTHAIHSSRCTR